MQEGLSADPAVFYGALKLIHHPFKQKTTDSGKNTQIDVRIQIVYHQKNHHTDQYTIVVLSISVRIHYPVRKQCNQPYRPNRMPGRIWKRASDKYCRKRLYWLTGNFP